MFFLEKTVIIFGFLGKKYVDKMHKKLKIDWQSNRIYPNLQRVSIHNVCMCLYIGLIYNMCAFCIYIYIYIYM